MSPAQIGEFEVLSRIGGGGMADVYRCRRRGIGGFEKILAVKRIRSERASDPEFVGMFLNEARLAANLNHPNIVQLFEMGEADGAPFIAMEYVPGPTIARLMRKMRREKRSEVRHVAGHVAKILADVCEGLHHAHTARGPDGEPMGLVHGDVSPQNIIVTRQGLPKLLDFGVAKASTRASEVKASNLKGKLKYMAPEQLQGKVDHRSDLFAVGICLFEATVGRSPYGSEDIDQATLFTNIAEGRFLRPSDLVAFYPRALEEIILAAIEPDLSRRCQSALELHDRLEEFVANGPYPSNTRAVSDWVNELFPEADESTPPMTPPRLNEGPTAGAVLAASRTPGAGRLFTARRAVAFSRRPREVLVALGRNPHVRRVASWLGGAAVAIAGALGGIALVRDVENPTQPPAAASAPAPAPVTAWRHPDLNIRTTTRPLPPQGPPEVQAPAPEPTALKKERPRKIRRAGKGIFKNKVASSRRPRTGAHKAARSRSAPGVTARPSLATTDPNPRPEGQAPRLAALIPRSQMFWRRVSASPKRSRVTPMRSMRDRYRLQTLRLASPLSR